LHVGHSSLKR